MPITFPLTAGILASVLHVITGPDHLAAVTPFAIEIKEKSMESWFILGNWSFSRNDFYRSFIFTF